MASQRQQFLVEKLDESLRRQAVDLSEEGAAEFAFPVACSQLVFDTLAGAGIAVLGGDLWREESDGYSAGHGGWFLPEIADGSTERLVEDARARWDDFIARVPDDSRYYVTFVA